MHEHSLLACFPRPFSFLSVTSDLSDPEPSAQSTVIHKLTLANEKTWLLVAGIAEERGHLEHALTAYENVVKINQLCLLALTQIAGISQTQENYPKAIEYYQRVLQLQEDNGKVWSTLGHCYLMQDDLQKADSAYQQALDLLPNPKEDPKLWYGIGILYDRYGSLDRTEEAFASVLEMDEGRYFPKANEILFRLGIIYKQQGKFEESLSCFDRILRNPPSPLAHTDIWLQIGHVCEQQKDYVHAKEALERVVADNPGHAKVLQQLGWLYHQDDSSFQSQELAIEYLTKSLEADPSDAQSWYLLGRAYMAEQEYNKAHEAYQQAVYRDGRNTTFWCSIGVFFFQINQFRDALDAYSCAIRINPYISEVWFDLGSLYESCNNQISDAIDAYVRASELDPSNHAISQRLELLENAQATGGQLPVAPGPQDVHPMAYANAVVPDFIDSPLPKLKLISNALVPGRQSPHVVLDKFHYPSSLLAIYVPQRTAGPTATVIPAVRRHYDPSDRWYFLGHAYMARQAYNKAHDAYQQAAYHYERNSTFWCAIGRLYLQMKRFRDARDAFSRAVRMNPYISEVKYDLSLHEGYNNQTSDACQSHLSEGLLRRTQSMICIHQYDVISAPPSLPFGRISWNLQFWKDVLDFLRMDE